MGILSVISKFLAFENEGMVAVMDSAPNKFKSESATLEARRAEVKERMKSFGRKPIIEGGDFKRGNTVLVSTGK